MNFIRKVKDKYFVRKQEQNDLEQFLCTLPGKCSKISKIYVWLNTIRDLFNKQRMLEIDEKYTWKDWIETQDELAKKKLKDVR
jgi:hypothetical protein